MTGSETMALARSPSTREHNALMRMTRTYWESRGTMGAGANTLGSLLAVGWIEENPASEKNFKKYKITESGLVARNAKPVPRSRKLRVKLKNVEGHFP